MLSTEVRVEAVPSTRIVTHPVSRIFQETDFVLNEVQLREPIAQLLGVPPLTRGRARAMAAGKLRRLPLPSRRGSLPAGLGPFGR